MKYTIVLDSSANLKTVSGTIPTVSVPLKIRVGKDEFVDDENLELDKMLSALESYNGKSGSACPGVEDYLQAFGDADRVFCITISGNLSGSFNAARLAKEDYEAAHPDRKVHVIDSLSAGPELKLIAEKLINYIENSVLYEEICKKIKAYHDRLGTLFSLESLRNLANNGRVNPLVAKIAGVMGIRVIGKASDEGQLEPLDKCPGEKRAMQKMLDRMLEMGYQGGKALIDHCRNLPAAEQLRQLILNKFPNAQVIIGENRGLCSFYAEQGGLIMGFEQG